MNADQDFANAISDFKKGGWMVGVLGGLGVVVRLLVSDERKGWIFATQRICAGTITGVITYFALYGLDISPIYKSAILATSGAFSPEIFKLVLSKIIDYGKRR